MILATDMADHMSQQNVIDYKLKHKGISKDKNNGHLMIDSSGEKEKFET